MNSSNDTPPDSVLSSSKQQNEIYPRDVEIGFTVLYVISILATLGGNSLMIYIVWKKPDVRTLTSFLFVNMAVSDIMVGLFVMPVSMVTPYTEGHWLSGIVGKFTCKVIPYIAYVSVTVSILTLTIMAVDRYLAVKFPIKSFRRLRKAKLLIPFIWITSLVLMCPWLKLMKLDASANFCNLKASQMGDAIKVARVFFAYIVVVLYLLPLGIMSVLYGVVIHHLWFHQTPGVSTNHNKRCEEATKKRAVRLLVTILVVFALCWLPAHVHHMFLVVDAQLTFSLPKYYMMGQNYVGHANSAINPWVIILLSHKFRSAFVQTAKSVRSKLSFTSRESGKSFSFAMRRFGNRLGSDSSTRILYESAV